MSFFHDNFNNCDDYRHSIVEIIRKINEKYVLQTNRLSVFPGSFPSPVRNVFAFIRSRPLQKAIASTDHVSDASFFASFGTQNANQMYRVCVKLTYVVGVGEMTKTAAPCVLSEFLTGPHGQCKTTNWNNNRLSPYLCMNCR